MTLLEPNRHDSVPLSHAIDSNLNAFGRDRLLIPYKFRFKDITIKHNLKIKRRLFAPVQHL